jgi:Ca2+-transporting ATPase
LEVAGGILGIVEHVLQTQANEIRDGTAQLGLEGIGAVIPAEMNPLTYVLRHDWRGVDVQTAETMAFITLSLCELFRAYTVRSERASIFKIGLFSNRYMQYAVGLSIALLVLVTAVPFLRPIFNTHFPSPSEWAIVIGLALIPAISEEITKFFLRRSEV